jgi:hypothetical protein
MIPPNRTPCCCRVRFGNAVLSFFSRFLIMYGSQRWRSHSEKKFKNIDMDLLLQRKKRYSLYCNLKVVAARHVSPARHAPSPLPHVFVPFRASHCVALHSPPQKTINERKLCFFQRCSLFIAAAFQSLSLSEYLNAHQNKRKREGR